jgi:hypothetical protein
MFKVIAAATLAALAWIVPVQAEWRIDQGTAIVSPSETNSTAELLVVSCGDPYLLEIFARGGPVKPVPAASDFEADYFYKPQKVIAVIDGTIFPMSAAGSGAAVVLFAQGTAEQDYLAPVPRSFLGALRGGTSLSIAFDIEPASAADGTPHETYARFPLEGSADALDDALAGCP